MWCVFAVRCVPCVRHAVHVGALWGVCGVLVGVLVWTPSCSLTQSLFAIALFGHGTRALVFTLDAACVRACRGVWRSCVPLGHSVMSSLYLCLCVFLCFSVLFCVCVCVCVCGTCLVPHAQRCSSTHCGTRGGVCWVACGDAPSGSCGRRPLRFFSSATARRTSHEPRTGASPSVA